MPEFEELDAESLGPEAQKLLEFLKNRVNGQDKVLNSFIKAIDLFDSGLRDFNKPIHTAILVGPAATGKTLLVRSLAEFWFGNPDAYLEISCQNYRREKDILSNIPSIETKGRYHIDPMFREKVDIHNALVEEKDGLIAELKNKKKLNSEKIEEMKKRLAEIDWILEKESGTLHQGQFNYRSIIVFDHLEWSDDNIWDFFCAMLENGYVIVNNTAVPITNSVIFITCGDQFPQKEINKEIGFVNSSQNKDGDFPEQKIYLKTRDQILNFFPKKFLSRINRAYIFGELSEKVLLEILKDDYRKFYNELTSVAGFPIIFRVESEANDFIVKESMDHPEFGARLLKSKFDKYIRKPIGRLKNQGKLKAGDKILIRFDRKRNKIIFLKEKNDTNPAQRGCFF